MRAARLNKNITIEYKVTTQDADYGTDIITWTTLYANVPAEVMDVLPGNAEKLSPGIEISANPSRIRTRWIPNLDSSMRITIHGEPDRVCQIVAGPAEIGKREGIEMMVVLYST
jgi:head-tail adaptor